MGQALDRPVWSSARECLPDRYLPDGSRGRWRRAHAAAAARARRHAAARRYGSGRRPHRPRGGRGHADPRNGAACRQIAAVGRAHVAALGRGRCRGGAVGGSRRCGIRGGRLFCLVGERFVDGGGSAQARREMFEIFKQLSVRDILVGTQSELIDSIRRTHGLEWGVENPVVRLLLYQGVVFTAFLVAGFVLFLIELGRRLRSGAAMPFAFFLIVVNSFESISNKTVLLGQFVVLMLAMFGRGSDQVPRLSSFRKPNEARLSGIN